MEGMVMQSIAELTMQLFESIEQRSHASKGSPDRSVRRVPTHFAEIDAITQGHCNAGL